MFNTILNKSFFRLSLLRDELISFKQQFSTKTKCSVIINSFTLHSLVYLICVSGLKKYYKCSPAILLLLSDDAVLSLRFLVGVLLVFAFLAGLTFFSNSSSDSSSSSTLSSSL